MSPRWATTAVFFVNGAVIGTWVAQIPWIQERFSFSNGTIGLVLLGMSVAVVVVFPLAGQAVAKHGSRRMTWLGGIACALAVNLPVLAPEPLLVVAGLAVLGGCSAVMDLSMNTHGVKVEKDCERPIMSSLHAGWAFGGMTGAAFAAATTAVGVDPRVSVPIASLVLLAALSLAMRRTGDGSAAAGEDTQRLRRPSRSVVLLAILCLLVMVTEGAMGDWGGIYLRRELGADAAVAAVAFSFFTAGMTVGRLAGDAINHRIGPVALLRWGALLTAVPLTVMLLIGSSVTALIGLFLIGLGVSNGVPLMFSAAGHQPDTPSGPAIAAVSSMGSLGFIVGPPLIGFVAQASSLPWALAGLIPGALAVFLLARRAAGPKEALPHRAPGL
jgi:fucose permease